MTNQKDFDHALRMARSYTMPQSYLDRAFERGMCVGWVIGDRFSKDPLLQEWQREYVLNIVHARGRGVAA